MELHFSKAEATVTKLRTDNPVYHFKTCSFYSRCEINISYLKNIK